MIRLVLATLLIAFVALLTACGSAPAASTREDKGAQTFSNYLIGMGKTENVADAMAATAKSFCKLVDVDGGNVTRMFLIASNSDVDPVVQAEVIRVGMQQLVCPQHAAAIDAWVASH